MQILDFIPVGHENAIPRQDLVMLTGLSDRQVRAMIEKECTREHPILNMQDGKGYFQPAENEQYLVRLYRAKENHRTLQIRRKCSELDKYLKIQNNEVEKKQISMFDIIGGD